MFGSLSKKAENFYKECKTGGDMKTKVAVLSMAELMEGNKRSCLSPLRALKRCFECPQYNLGTYKENGTTKHGCESRIINKEYDNLQTEKQKMQEEHNAQIAAINERIKNI